MPLFLFFQIYCSQLLQDLEFLLLVLLLNETVIVEGVILPVVIFLSSKVVED